MSINYLPIDNSIALVTSAVTDALTGDAITDATITAAVLSVGGSSLCSAAMTHDAGGVYKGTLDLSTASTDLVLNTHYYLQLSASNYALVWKRLLRAEDRPLVGSGSVSIDLTPGTSGLPSVDGIPLGDGTGAYAAATPTEVTAATGGGVVIHHKTGRMTAYVPTADTNSARYTALASAVGAAIAYDRILAGPGSYDFDGSTTSNSLTLPDNVSLIGNGTGQTILTCTLKGGTGGMIVPGNNSQISDLSIHSGSTTSGNGDATIAIGFNDGTTTVTGVRILNVSIDNASTDGFFFSGAGSSEVKIYNCNATSEWDCAVLGFGAFELHDCTFSSAATATTGDHNGNATAIVDNTNCTIRCYGCHFSATSTVFSGTVLGTVNATGGGAIYLFGCDVSSASGIHFDVCTNDGAGGVGTVYTDAGTTFDKSRLAGPVTGNTNGYTVSRAGTSSGTQATLQTITIPASTTVLLQSYVTARRTGGSSGTAEDGGAYIITAAVKNVAGTATLMSGSPTVTTVGEDQAGWNATIDVTAATARIRITGAANNTIAWNASTYQQIISS